MNTSSAEALKQHSNEDVVDKSRRYLAYITYGIMATGVGLMLVPGMAVAGGLLVGGAIVDIAADKTLGAEVSRQWKELKVKIGNIFKFRGSKTPQTGTASL